MLSFTYLIFIQYLFHLINQKGTHTLFHNTQHFRSVIANNGCKDLATLRFPYNMHEEQKESWRGVEMLHLVMDDII